MMILSCLHIALELHCMSLHATRSAVQPLEVAIAFTALL